MSIASVALSPVVEDSLTFAGNFISRHGLPLTDSILIFLTVGGSVIPIRVSESDSIASVKLRIQTHNGYYVKKQKLVFKGRELARDNSRVHDYGVTDGNVLHLVLRLSDLQAITVRTVCGKEFEIHVERRRNVGYVKQQIAKKGKGLVDLKGQRLICDGEELEDQKLITDICRSNEAVIHLLVRKSAKVRAKPLDKDFEVSIEALTVEEDPVLSKTPQEKDLFLEPVTINSEIELPLLTRKLIESTYDGLEKGNQPIRSSEGSGGAYFMQDSSGQHLVSVFKPIDEEPMAVNNPRGLPVSTNGEGLKKGTRVGEGAFREVAAYFLDHQGFAGVPPTVMVKCFHRGFNNVKSSENVKIGSLQMFMENHGSCEDMGPRAFPVDEVHKICVLDIRLANADRHAGNILVRKNGDGGRIVLIPIDHGYCLPENFEDCTFDWLYWPQAQQPFSSNTIDYIKTLDAEQDIKILKFHGWDLSLQCARILRISTMLLKKGAERGLTPFTIGKVMCRETLTKQSVIEQIVQEANESVLPGSSEDIFLESVAEIMDSRLDELTV